LSKLQFHFDAEHLRFKSDNPPTELLIARSHICYRPCHRPTVFHMRD
jgi:hypothetical protein